MKRNSISNKIGKYLDFLKLSSSITDKSIDPDMAHPGYSAMSHHSHAPHHQHSNESTHYNPPAHQRGSAARRSQRKKDVFDTANFDQIDYIVQIPLITNPTDRQSRFLLAMDYTLNCLLSAAFGMSIPTLSSIAMNKKNKMNH